jgi:hypothetical protein
MTMTSLFDYEQRDIPTGAGGSPGTDDGDEAAARRQLDAARHDLLETEAAYRSDVVRAQNNWLRSLPPTIGRRSAERIETIYEELEDARHRGRRPWDRAARRDAKVLDVELQLTLERYGFADYEAFTARHDLPPKPVPGEPATVRRARKAVARAEANLESCRLRASA